MVTNTQNEHEIRNESNKMKKNRGKESVIEVLQIIGLSEKPLSTYEIEKIWIQKFGYDKNLENEKHPHIYEVIKHLSKSKPEYWGKPHPERFLEICFTEKIQQEIKVLEKKYHLEPHKIEDGMEVISRTISNPLEGKHLDNAIIRIHNLKKESRNWRYHLNYKAFLKYLIWVHQKSQVSKRTINAMMKNLSSYSDFEFLQYFDIFGSGKVGLLVEIAVELQFQLKTLTLGDLRYYVINRCYKEISEWLSTEERTKKFFHFKLKEDEKNVDVQKRKEEAYELILELRNYKSIVVNELFDIEQKRLEDIMIDRIRTKQSTLAS